MVEGGNDWKTSLPTLGAPPVLYGPLLCTVISPHPSSSAHPPSSPSDSKYHQLLCSPLLALTPPPSHIPAWPCPGAPHSSLPPYPSQLSSPLQGFSPIWFHPHCSPCSNRSTPPPSTFSSALVPLFSPTPPCDTPYTLRSPSPSPYVPGSSLDPSACCLQDHPHVSVSAPSPSGAIQTPLLLALLPMRQNCLQGQGELGQALFPSSPWMEPRSVVSQGREPRKGLCFQLLPRLLLVTCGMARLGQAPAASFRR